MTGAEGRTGRRGDAVEQGAGRADSGGSIRADDPRREDHGGGAGPGLDGCRGSLGTGAEPRRVDGPWAGRGADAGGGPAGAGDAGRAVEPGPARGDDAAVPGGTVGRGDRCGDETVARLRL